MLGLCQQGHAQSAPTPATIPLDVISESGGSITEDRLGINVGVNGATPEEYIFDTGSTAFNIDVGSSANGQAWFPLLPGVAINPGSPLEYGNGSYGNLASTTTVASIQFYNSGTQAQAASLTNSTGIPVSLNTGNYGTQASPVSKRGRKLVTLYQDSECLRLLSLRKLELPFLNCWRRFLQAFLLI
jgi:subtilase-type serine protease